MADNQITGLTNYSTPQDVDVLPIVDISAGTSGTKKITWSSIKTALSTLYVALTGDQTISGIKTFTSKIIAEAIDLTGINGTGFLTLKGQSVNPASPAAGSMNIHAATVNGFTRLEQDNEAATNLVYGRDNVFIAKNESGVTINKGEVVYTSGTVSGVPQITKARANSSGTLPAIGIAMDTINHLSFGQVMYSGILVFNTSAFMDGNTVWVSPTTAGGLTATRPSGTNYVQRMGTILVSNATTGIMLVQTAPVILNMETGTNATTFAANAITATSYNGYTPENAANKSTSTSLGTSDTLYPTQNAVKTYADNLVSGLLDYRGAYNASVNTWPASGGSGTAGAVMKGDMWIVSVAGTLGGSAVQIGDSLIASIDAPGQTAGNWNILNSNISYVPEDIANKVTSISGASTDTQYPSAKLTYDQLALKAALAGSTAQAFAASTIDVGNVDTTISRSAAGIIAVEGVAVPTISSTDTLTNKTLTTPTISKPVMSATNPTDQTYSPAAAGTATLDLSLSNSHSIQMPSGNITIALSNDTNNQKFIVKIKQDATGSRTVTWFSTITWAGGSAPTLTTGANKTDIIGFWRTGTGTYQGFVVAQNI